MKTPKITPRHILMTILLTGGLLAAGCSRDDETGKADGASPAAKSGDAASATGVGPIKNLPLEPLDETLASRGEQIFSGTCAACHKMDRRYVGPALAGVTKRRTPEWIMNMIMNPVEMTQKDPTAKALLAEYMTQMSVNASEEDARALLEYFRKVDDESTPATPDKE